MVFAPVKRKSKTEACWRRAMGVWTWVPPATGLAMIPEKRVSPTSNNQISRATLCDRRRGMDEWRNTNAFPSEQPAELSRWLRRFRSDVTLG
jgi:hypothetical protein